MNKSNNRIAAVILFLGLWGFMPSTLAAAKPNAPQFLVNGQTPLSHYQGKIVYLDFWASWCGPCRKSFPWMNSLSEKFSAQDFVVLSVNVDGQRSAAKQFLTRYPANFSITYDPDAKVAEQYKVMGMPTSYILDRQGRIAHTHIGFTKARASKYEQQISELIQGKQQDEQ